MVANCLNFTLQVDGPGIVYYRHTSQIFLIDCGKATLESWERVCCFRKEVMFDRARWFLKDQALRIAQPYDSAEVASTSSVLLVSSVMVLLSDCFLFQWVNRV